MFTINWDRMTGDIASIVAAYDKLPRYIAKKHMKAGMRRALKPGIPILKRNTPKMATFVKNGSKVKGGGLRRAATSRVGYKGKNKDGFVFGVLGYKAGWESRKAIWLENGTRRGVLPRAMIKRTMDQFGPRIRYRLTVELKEALAKAVKELASGKNPGVGKSGFGPGRR